MTRLVVGKAELLPVGGPLLHEAGNARGPFRERYGAFLRLEADGLVGWGECSPLPGMSPDRLEDAAAALGRVLSSDLPSIDLDAPVGDIKAWVERVPSSLPSARFALDTALFDLCARAYGVSLASLLGEAIEPVRASQIIELDDWEASAARATASDVHAFKIKVGRPDRFALEIAALSALRQAYPDAGLRLDANGVFGARTAESAIHGLASVAPEWIEQPVPPGLLSALAPPPCPIAADESAAADDDDLWRAVHRGVVSILVIKPAMVGGILAAVDLAERARSLEVEVVISHLLDGPVALAAAAELAIGLGSTRAAGLGSHVGLTAYGPIAVPQLQRGMLVSCGPGLGLVLE